MLSLLWQVLSQEGGALEAWDHRRRRGTILATRGVGPGRVWAGAGRAGGAGFRGGRGRAGRVEGGGRGGTFVHSGYGPIRCGRFGVKNVRGVKIRGGKETSAGDSTWLFCDVLYLAKKRPKVNFVDEKKLHHPETCDTQCVYICGLYIIRLYLS